MAIAVPINRANVSLALTSSIPKNSGKEIRKHKPNNKWNDQSKKTCGYGLPSLLPDNMQINFKSCDEQAA